MAVHAHAPAEWRESDDLDAWEPRGQSAGRLAGPMFGRPPYWAAGGTKRQCKGTTNPGFRCQSRAHWLLPEDDYCAHHVPHHLLEVMAARRDLWASLACDLWGQVIAELPAP